MKMKGFIKFLPVALMLALLSTGCVQQTESTATAPAPQEAPKADPFTYKGKIAGKSNKAQTISITVGKGDAAKDIMVRFDDDTDGVEYAKKGEAAIIKWEQRGDDKFATVIKPKLAKLPEGVEEIKAEELYKMVTDHVPMFLADARPELRYNQGHLPSAVSVPVPLLKEKKAKVLPKEKDKLIVFYCGGYT